MSGQDRSYSRIPLAVGLAVAALVVVPATAVGLAGNFSQPSTSPESAGPAPLSVTAAQLGGGAAMDLAVTDFAASEVHVLLGDGTGNFTPAATSPEGVCSTSNAVAAANLNGDANVDLAVANLDCGNVTILLGDGTGNFTPAGSSPEAVGAGPISIVAAPLDGDADIDLAVLNNDDSNVSILLNDGAGDFTAAGTEAVGGDPRAIVAAHLGGSASIDLAVANRSTDSVTILLGDGTGNFTEPPTSEEAVGDAPNGLAAGNFGGDATTDLATANRDSDDVTILLGSASGDFVRAPTSPEPVGDAPRSLAAANLGGTASTDLAVANSGSDNVSILLGNGGGNFTAAGTSPEAAGDEPFSIVAASFGGGPGLDLATANPSPGFVSILLNDAPAPPVKCGGRNATKVGTASADRIKGTAGRDVIAGLGGNDRIRGLGGNDVLCGGAGRDTLIGGPGRDTLIGGAGRDTLIGGPGRDRLLGQAGKDTCKGGPKRDVARKCEVKRTI